MKAQRARDFVIYIMVGLAVAVGTVWYGFHFKTHKTETLGKWIGFSGITAILFGYAIRAHWRALRQGWFWTVPCPSRAALREISLLFSVHLVGFIFVLRLTQHWPLLWFIFVYPIENFLLVWVLSASSGLWRRREVTPRRGM